jgi:hypothetical protein
MQNECPFESTKLLLSLYPLCRMEGKLVGSYCSNTDFFMGAPKTPWQRLCWVQMALEYMLAEQGGMCAIANMLCHTYISILFR